MVNERERQHRVPPLVPTALVALLLGLAILVAPSIGTWEMDAREFEVSAPEPEQEGPPPEEQSYEESEDETFEPPTDAEPIEISPIWGQLLLGLVILMAVAAAAIAVWLFVRYRSSLTPDVGRADLRVDAEVAPEDQIPILTEAATSAREELRHASDPTDAIIRAWLALEDAAAQSGMSRRPADTPTDLTVAVLTRTEADPEATTGLLSLYHRARFGTEPMSPAEQSEAVTHLEALARSWDRVRL